MISDEVNNLGSVAKQEKKQHVITGPDRHQGSKAGVSLGIRHEVSNNLVADNRNTDDDTTHRVINQRIKQSKSNYTDGISNHQNMIKSGNRRLPQMEKNGITTIKGPVDNRDVPEVLLTSGEIISEKVPYDLEKELTIIIFMKEIFKIIIIICILIILVTLSPSQFHQITCRHPHRYHIFQRVIIDIIDDLSIME